MKVGLEQDPATSTIYYNDSSNYEDLRFPAQGINPAGSTSPATVSTEDGCLLFDKTIPNIISGVAQTPHGHKKGSPFLPHIHWQGTSAPGANTDVYWLFEHQKASINGKFSGSWVQSAKIGNVDSDPNKHQILAFDPIDMSDMSISCIIKWRLTRVASSDTYNADAKLLEVDFHYELDSVGSGQEYKK